VPPRFKLKANTTKKNDKHRIILMVLYELGVQLLAPFSSHFIPSAWSVYKAASMLLNAANFFMQVTAFGVFQAFYTTTLLNHYSASDISWIGGVQYFFGMGCAPFGGKLVDAGYSRTAVLCGSLLSSFRFVSVDMNGLHNTNKS
jgi:hypothetical protein